MANGCEIQSIKADYYNYTLHVFNNGFLITSHYYSWIMRTPIPYNYVGRPPYETPQFSCSHLFFFIFKMKDCSRFVRRFLLNLTSESKFVRGKSHKSSKIPGVMCPPSTGGSHAGGFVRRSSHKSAGPEYRPSTSRAIVR